MDLEKALLPPGQDWRHFLGTDELGQDLAARFFLGGLVTLALALPARVFLLIWVVLLSGSVWLFPRLEFFWRMAADLFLALPSILLALIIAALTGGGLTGILLALILSDWAYAYIALSGRIREIGQTDYLRAARLMGGGPWHSFRYHILPVSRSFLLELFITGLSSTVLTLSLLSFLGLGVPELGGVTDWGSQIAYGKNYLLDAPLLALLPSAGIIALVLFFNRYRARSGQG